MPSQTKCLLIKENLDLLPHRPPMVWIDSLTDLDRETTRAFYLLRKDGLYFDQGRFVPSWFLELIGQTYGYSTAFKQKSLKKHLRICYIAAVNDFTVSSYAHLRAGQTLEIQVRTLHDLHPFYVLEGFVFSEDKVLLCRAQIKGYAETAEDAP
jgi:predicted hotdog family 3-hydroxylacyl-ACP dehydratase